MVIYPCLKEKIQFSDIDKEITLLPCPGYCKQCYNEHQGACRLLNSGFLQLYEFMVKVEIGEWSELRDCD